MSGGKETKKIKTTKKVEKAQKAEVIQDVWVGGGGRQDILLL